jgi:hypothetical protein
MGFSAVLGVVGVGLQMAGAARQAQAQRAQLRAQSEQQRQQAEIAAKQEFQQKVNAAIAGKNADSIRLQGQEAAANRGLRTRQVVGAARAAIAGNGVVLEGAGTTPGALLGDLRQAGAQDVLNIYKAARAEQQRALVQQENFTAQADIFDAHQGMMIKAAQSTSQQANMISPGLAALTAGVGGLTSISNLLF